MTAAAELANHAPTRGDRRSHSPRTKAAVLVALIAILVAIAIVAGRAPRLSGSFAGADGMSELEFRGSRVYVTTSLGTTFVAGYEIDGDKVIIKGAGGAQVYTRQGDTLDGGIGIKFIKR